MIDDAHQDDEDDQDAGETIGVGGYANKVVGGAIGVGVGGDTNKVVGEIIGVGDDAHIVDNILSFFLFEIEKKTTIILKILCLLKY